MAAVPALQPQPLHLLESQTKQSSGSIGSGGFQRF